MRCRWIHSDWHNGAVCGAVMFILAVVGLAVNISLFMILGGHHHGPFHSHDHGHDDDHNHNEHSHTVLHSAA